MKNDDWSLKGKKGDIHRELSYSISDIDILHQKLIEDFTKMMSYNFCDPNKVEKITICGLPPLCHIIKIINKRFGKE